jgi:mRNA interferase RelE/StbE
VAVYNVRIKRSAAKEIEAIGQRRDRQRVVARIEGLAEDPRPEGSEKLAGSSDLYRVRVGTYRILYAVDDAVRVVAVTRVGHRKEAYRGLT